MAHRPNKWAIKGGCADCKTPVPALAGVVHFVGGQWVGYCYDHANLSPTAPAAAPPKRRVIVGGDGPARVTCDLTDRGSFRFLMLGISSARLFGEVRTALHGCDRDDKDNSYRCRLEIGVTLIDRLRKIEDISLELAPEIGAALQAHAAAAASDQQSAEQRSLAIDAKLLERGQTLFPFQRIGSAWLAQQYGAILADDMGLGKTIQALVAAAEGAPIVVVCPNVAKGVWLREAKRWRPDLTPYICSGRNSFRWPTNGEMCVINYDILSEATEDCPICKDHKDDDIEAAENVRSKPAHKTSPCVAIPPALEGTIIIADESHAIKNLKASRSRRFRALAKRARKVQGRVWLLTGTPLLNRPNELWSLLSTLSKSKQVFGNWDNFKHMLAVEGGNIDTPKIAERLKETMLRRMKKDMLKQMPPKMIDVLNVDIDATAQRNLDAIAASLAAKGIDLEKALSAAIETKSAAIDIGTLSTLRSVLALAKVPAAMAFVDELEDQGEPVIVFSAHRAPAELFGARPGWALITGDTPPSERTRIEESFQRGELRGVAGTIVAMGVAITLTRAANVVFVDPEWVPALNEQAEDRAYRIGQLRSVNVVYLIANHKIDELVQRCLTKKRKLIEATVNAAISQQGAA